MESHPALRGEAAKAAVAGQQGPLSPLCDGESERIGCGELLPFSTNRGGARQFYGCQLLNPQSERNEAIA